ncbi:teichoic acid D-Ala incorporation-associated protein DltX [Enterococcus bulliens]|nr:teichoic acid D-Ala incorporation-associated protein DltX [uncultured Enterococcus sp.]
MNQAIRAFFAKDWVRFVGRTCLYIFIFVMLIYLYHYKNIQGGSFIYNEF